MFEYCRNLSNGRLCELFIEHGGLISDGVNVIRREDNLFQTIPQDELQIEMRKLLTPASRLEISSSRLDSIIKLIIQNPEINVDATICNQGKILFKNGIYDVNNGMLYPHDEKYNWAVVDAEYEENARLEDAPTFLKFVISSLDYNTKPEKTELLLEIVGYCLSDYTLAKKAFFFIGEPSSGKSKILEFLQKLVGDEDVSQIPLPLIGSRFSMGQLRGKRLNICTELPSNKFPAIEPFKALTACDRVYGEMKGQDGFSFYPRIKLLNAGNAVPFPANTDGTFSVADRMVFLIFSHSIPRSEWKLNLVEDLLAEKNIICSLAMKSLTKLLKSGFEFTVPHESKIFANSYTESLNAFDIFIRESCILEDDVQIGSQLLWDSYQNFCADNTFPKGISQQLFVQKVESIEGVHKKRIRENGKQFTVFKGISVRSPLDYWDDIRTSKTLKTNTNKLGQCDTKIRREPLDLLDLESSFTPAQKTRS